VVKRLVKVMLANQQTDGSVSPIIIVHRIILILIQLDDTIKNL